MADMNTQSTSGVAWLALLIGLIALVLAWVAFDRTGNDVVPAVQETTEAVSNEAQENAEVVAARIAAETELAAIRTRVVAEDGYEEALARTQTVRSNLAEVYTNASDEAREEWTDIEAEFDEVENELRTKSANALGVLDRLISRLREDVQTDEED